MNPYEVLQQGTVIPASPLALNARRHLDERRQRGLWRYYEAAGAGGVAVGVHTTQFAIREIGLYEPLLVLAGEEFSRLDARRESPLVRIAGICGATSQACAEAKSARSRGFHLGLLSLSAFKDASTAEILNHCREVGDIIPLMGFYLQPAVGGRSLPYDFWRHFSEIESVHAIKVAPFNRYQTLEVMRAVADSDRNDIALYTGNDDAIVSDLTTPYVFSTPKGVVNLAFVGGLLGHWAVWTRTAVQAHAACRSALKSGTIPAGLLQLGAEITDCNAAFFDSANNFSGCIAGLHEVLRRQGLLEGTWCINSNETLSPGQITEIDRVYQAYPHLNDDAFIENNRDAWLSG